jgi:hypothetical protein
LRKLVRNTILVPADLKKRIEHADGAHHWSAIASAAFEAALDNRTMVTVKPLQTLELRIVVCLERGESL